ncbi:MAG: hypothetical protein U0414_43565 [Polyangiaceae bacterium]
MKAQSPLLGFNNNVRHKGRVFHIQTEDSGVKHPHVITHLFADGGRIVRSQKTSYAEFVGDEELQRKVRSLMQEQHKAMFIALRAGKFDHLLDSVPITEPIPPDRASAPQAAPPSAKEAPPSLGRAPMESTVSIEIGNEGDPKSVVHIAPGQPIPTIPKPAPSDRGAASPQALAPEPAPSEKRPSPRPHAFALTETALQEVRPAEPAPRPPTLPPPSLEAAPDTEVVRERPVHVVEPSPQALAAPIDRPLVRQDEPKRGRSPSQGLRRLTPPPPLPSNTLPGGARPMDRSSAVPHDRASAVPAARPPTMIPPSAKPLTNPVSLATGPTLPAVAAVVPPPSSAPSVDTRAPRRNSGLLAALGALSSGAKAPSLGASPPQRAQGASLGVPPRIGAGLGPDRGSERGAPSREPAPAPEARGIDESRDAARLASLDLDLQALERAAEQGNSPVYRQVRDFPAPPQALRNTGSAHARSITPGAAPPAVPAPSPSQPGSRDERGPSSGNRYAPSRPAAIFGASRPQEGSSIFGEDLISEKSLDEVILSYLAEDLDAPKK